MKKSTTKTILSVLLVVALLGTAALAGVINNRAASATIFSNLKLERPSTSEGFDANEYFGEPITDVFVPGTDIPVLSGAGTASPVDGVVCDSNGKNAIAVRYSVPVKKAVPSEVAFLRLNTRASSSDIIDATLMDVCFNMVVADEFPINNMFYEPMAGRCEGIGGENGVCCEEFIFPITHNLEEGMTIQFVVSAFATDISLADVPESVYGEVIASIDASIGMDPGAIGATAD